MLVGFVLALVATGIVLNHTSELGLDRQYIDWPWLQRAYGDQSSTLPAYFVDNHWVFRAANSRLYLDEIEVSTCDGLLVGVAQLQGMLLAACSKELVLMTATGELIESVRPSTGLPVPVQSLGLIAGALTLQTNGTWYLADIDQMRFDQPAAAAGSVINQIVADRLPAKLRAQIPIAPQWLTWERFLLDAHSGRIFGRGGVWFVDALGVLLASLATSGTLMWLLHRRRRSRKKT